MKKIGQILKDARVGKKLSYKKLEDETKIKSVFIKAVEDENWESLPSLSTVMGFVKNLASALSIDEKMAIAVLKRDYPPKKISINPKPDISSRFTWSPKLTFAVGIGIVVLAILGYLAFQYIKFISPPGLTVESPKENQIIDGNSVLVFGSTDPDAKVSVNNQPVLTDSDGKFSVSIGVTQSTKEVDVVATGRSGKVSTVKRDITVANN